MKRERDCTVPLKYKLHVTTHSYNGAFLSHSGWWICSPVYQTGERAYHHELRHRWYVWVKQSPSGLAYVEILLLLLLII